MPKSSMAVKQQPTRNTPSKLEPPAPRSARLAKIRISASFASWVTAPSLASWARIQSLSTSISFCTRMISSCLRVSNDKSCCSIACFSSGEEVNGLYGRYEILMRLEFSAAPVLSGVTFLIDCQNVHQHIGPATPARYQMCQLKRSPADAL